MANAPRAIWYVASLACFGAVALGLDAVHTDPVIPGWISLGLAIVVLTGMSVGLARANPASRLPHRGWPPNAPPWAVEWHRLGLFLFIFGIIEIDTPGRHFWPGLPTGLLAYAIGPGLIWFRHNRRVARLSRPAS